MTLSDITGDTRTLLKWLGFIIVALIVFSVLTRVKDAIFPAAPPPPTVGFGKLPQAEFPSNGANTKLNYSLNTVTGTLPVFPTSQRVYKMQEGKPDLLSLNRAKGKANAVGFDTNPTQVSENVYQWKAPNNTTLTMNILNFDFNLSSDYLTSKNMPVFNRNADIAPGVAKDFLQRMTILPSDLDETKTITNLFLIKNFKLVSTTSLSTAQVIRVNFFQKDFNNLPIYYSSPNSPLNFLVGTPQDPQILEANFFYQKPGDFFSTYPIKTAQKAFNELKSGNAYISIPALGTNVSIKKISLGYFMADKKQDYLIPIVVFDGDNFEAYVSAVTDEWVNK